MLRCVLKSVGDRVVDDQRPGAHHVEQEAVDLGGLVRVERGAHVTAEGDSRDLLDRLRPVRSQDRDAVARLDAELRQRVRESAGALEELAIGLLELAADDRGAISVPSGGAAQDDG
jgi:hypothetical protein